MKHAILLLLSLAVTACGVQRPLMKPKDIPAYEEQQRKKREKYNQEIREQQEQQQQAAPATSAQ